MPNRILRDYTDSLRFDGITAEAERLFVRLLMKADDYGRFHAEPRLLRAGCFPLHDTIRANDLTRWLDELSHRQLILRYEVDSRKLLAVVNFGQRLKLSRAKFPAPLGKEGDFLASLDDFPAVPGTSRNFPPETKRNEVETNPTPNTESADARDGAAKRLATEGFDEFWQVYPKKIAKPDAQRAWVKHGCAQITPGIIAAVRKAALSFDWKKEAGQYIPHPATWLNRRGWEDELRPSNQPAREKLSIPVTKL